MSAINCKELSQLYRLKGPEQMNRHLTEALENKDLSPSDFDFSEIAEATLGREFIHACKPGGENGDVTRILRIKEEGDALDSTAFLNITQRVISQQIMDAFLMESNIAASLVSLETNVNVKNERRPGITSIGDEGEAINEGMPYPRQTIGEKYQDFGDNRKRGLIVPITKECLFFVGQSGEILRQASRVGEWLGVNKDKRIWNVILGITNNYNYNGVAYTTYNTAAVTAGTPALAMGPANIHPYRLLDWTDIDAAERWFDLMVDPDNGEAIEIGGTSIIVMPARWANARRILNATTVWHGELDTNQRGAIANTLGDNPLAGYTLVPKSRRAYKILVDSNDFGCPSEVWLMGNFKKAFVYRENWPVQVTQAPLNSTAEFEQDIVAQYKASERGGAHVLRPHYVVISSGTCGHSSSGDTVCTPKAWAAIDTTQPNKDNAGCA